MDKEVEKIAKRVTQSYYNSGNMLNEMRVASSPEEQLINAHKLGMVFPEEVHKQLSSPPPVLSGDKRLEIARKVFGTNDGIRPKFPQRGETIQEFSIEVAQAQIDLLKKKGCL